MPDNPKVQYLKDGRPISSHQNKLSSMAYWYTKGIKDGVDRLSSADFKAELTKLGVKDPTQPGWDVTLPNGIRLSAVEFGTVVTPPPAAPKAPKVAKAASPKKVAASTLMRDAANALRKAGRYSGDDKIEITKENAAALVAASVDEIKAMPATPKATPEVTPITKASQTRRPATRKAPARKASAKKAPAKKVAAKATTTRSTAKAAS